MLRSSADDDLGTELVHYLRVLRKRWRTVALTVAVCLLAVGSYSLLAPATYAATTRLFISTAGGDNSLDLLQGSSFSEQRVKSYADLVTSPAVLQPVIEKLKLDDSANELSKRVSTNIPADTVLLDISVRGSSAAETAHVARAIADQLRIQVRALESVGGAGKSPVKVSVVAKAEVPQSPVAPKPIRNSALAMIFGLLCGAALAVLRENLDTRIMGRGDIAKDAVTVIGSVSYDAEAHKHPLVVQTDPHSGRAEAFRSLRTNLQYVDAASHPRSLVFTSSVPNEGKTTTAANLATTMAAGGARVCLVEADLRRPRLLRYMGLEGGVGLTTVLIGQVGLSDVLQEFAGLTVLGAGHVPPNPSELLGSRVMRETVRELEHRFDVVIIDAPPLLPVTDAAVLSTIADGTVVVVGVGSTKREQLFGSINALERVNANILGVVLNKLPIKGPDSYRYGYYREGYAPEGSGEQAQFRKGRMRHTEPSQR